MQKKKVFIDGGHGTTGLIILETLQGHPGVELVKIPEDQRKKPQARALAASHADVAILCLPDQAALEAVELYSDFQEKLKIIDASTAHRTQEGWTFGLAELSPGQRKKIAEAQNIANPGCYPIGAILLLRPLIKAGLVDAEQALTIFGVSGYTGGGSQMIAEYSGKERTEGEASPDPFRPYSLTSPHKHLPEIMRYTGLRTSPHFIPSVGNAPRGMLDIIPLPAQGELAASIHQTLSGTYANESFIRVRKPNEGPGEAGKLAMCANKGTNFVDLHVFRNGGGLTLAACFDNLGKGAALNAVQNLNIALGFPEATGILSHASA